MYYPEEIIEDIRVQNDIVDTISEYVTLNKKGNSYFGLCPFHNEKTPSFSVSEEKQMYYCFGCGVGGNVITFIMEKENFGFVETIKYLADKKNIQLPEAKYSKEVQDRINQRQMLIDLHKEVGIYYYYNLQSESEDIKNYLTNRQIKPEIQKKFGIGYSKSNYTSLYRYLKEKGYTTDIMLKSGLILKSKKGNSYYDRFTDRLMFPIFDVHGKVIAFGGRVLDNSQPKYLNSPETQIFEKNATLYGLNYARVSRQKEVFIVEGYMDVIAMYQAGIKNVVATLGTAFTQGHADLIKRYFNNVILLYDSDDAGVRAALRAIPILQSNDIKVRVLHLPDKQDPDDYITKYGVESLKTLANNADGAVAFQGKIIKQKYDITNTEQKIRFIEELSDLIANLSSAIEQEVYMAKVSKDYGIDIDALKTEVRKRMQQLQNKNINKSIRNENIQLKTAPKQSTNVKHFKTQSELLQIMCSYPNVLLEVKKHLEPSDFKGEFFQKLVKLIYEKNVDGFISNPSSLTNSFEKKEEQKQLANILLAKREYKSNDILNKVVTDTVKKLKIQSIEEQLKTTTDITQLQKLLQDKKVVDKLYIECISG